MAAHSPIDIAAIRPYGDHAVLVLLEDAAAVTPLHTGLLAALGDHAGLSAVVPAARSVLVEFEPSVLAPARVREAIRAAALEARGPVAATSLAALHIEVRYDGPDLNAVAAAAGLSSDAVIALHSEAEYTVQFCGFSPGFGYLTGLPEPLRLPRLDAPRAKVPAGSVAIAGDYTGVYPKASPGGWRLLGHTDAVLFELHRDPPALFVPGRSVRFVPA
jgi:KipI family sensor histidine kinase inhibitor